MITLTVTIIHRLSPVSFLYREENMFISICKAVTSLSCFFHMDWKIMLLWRYCFLPHIKRTGRRGSKTKWFWFQQPCDVANLWTAQNVWHWPCHNVGALSVCEDACTATATSKLNAPSSCVCWLFTCFGNYSHFLFRGHIWWMWVGNSHKWLYNIW